MLRLKNEYGNDQKIHFAFVQAHGEPDRFILGDLGMFAEKGDISTQTHINHHTASLFTENPTIILASCSTGQEKGIAQKLSMDLHATVIGPEEPGAIVEMKVVQNQNGIKMEPEYAKPKSDKREDLLQKLPVKANLYINGEAVTGEQYDDYFAELATAP